MMSRKFTLLVSLLMLACYLPSKGQTSSYCPPNVDFEYGSFTNWACYSGSCTPLAGTYTFNMVLTGPRPTLHTLNTTGTDPYGGFGLVAPGGGVYSCKIGKDSTNYNCDEVRYYIHVPSGPSTYSLLYKYATVLEDPASHPVQNKPRMVINAWDSASGTVVPCASISYTQVSSAPGFIYYGSDIYYKPWTTGNMKFPGLGGHTVAIDFKVGGCSQSGHWGYGYVDMSCGIFQIIYVSCGGSSASLAAPAGYQYYHWYDSVTFGTSYGTTQIVTITVPTVTTVYAVVCTPYAGYGCPDTLYTHVVPSNLVVHKSNDTTICGGASVTLTSGATDILPLTYYWTPSTGLSCTTCDPVVATPSVTTAYIVTVTDAGGCLHTDTINVNVVPTPTTILGTMTVCQGLTSNLSDAVTGGTWSSSNTSVATMGTSSGVLYGVSAGTTIITYSMGGMCNTVRVATVNPLPSAISGTTSVCVGLCNTLSDATGGGTWISSAPSVATIGSSSGTWCGVAAGTSIITYKLSATTCQVTTVVTVNPNPAAIVGRTTLCVGLFDTLNESTSGGVWSSSNTSVATVINPTRNPAYVYGLTGGTAVITYTLPTGCIATWAVTVNALPTGISGTTTLCPGGFTATLSEATGGGSWSSSDVTIASVVAGPSTSTVVTSGFPGTAVITYTLPTGCITTTTMTVFPTVPAISGNATICVGNTSLLSDAVTGGTWSSSLGTVATVNSSSGLVTGSSLGTATITYMVSTGCYTARTVTVTSNPGPISGAGLICIGSVATVSDPTSSGSWSISPLPAPPGPATIFGTGTIGTITGVNSGTSTITYTLSTGCYSTAVETVIPSPGSITGTNHICVGSCTTLSDATPGGTWGIYPSAGSAYVSMASPPTVCGVAQGTATITYQIATGTACRASYTVTVAPNPAAILGGTAVCIGSCMTLSDATAGGAWSSSATSVATVNSTGSVCGVSLGTTIITYAMPSGCFTTTTVTVSPTPGPILGSTSICTGQCTTLSNSVSGGTWATSSSTVATIGATSGTICGLAAGTTVITYSLGSGCRVTTTVVVSPSPNAISGSSSICVGQTTCLSSTTAGGTWSSSTTSVATVTGTGCVGGVLNGTTTITYMMPTGCYATYIVTVQPTPGFITGATSMCAFTCSLLANSVPGGVWTSSNTSVATVGSSSGTLCGVATGTSVISYTLSSGCKVTAVATIFNSPGAIVGPTAVCVGACVSLSNSVSGGVWSSTNTSVATVGSSSGSLCGVAFGTTIISYTMPGGCYVTTTISVPPPPGPILGSLLVCNGSCNTLSDASGGGLWTSSAAGTASIGSSTGLLCGVTLGTANITYSLGTGCSVYGVATVTPTPSAILGASSMCAGSCTTLTDATPGGTWYVGGAAIGSVGSICSAVAGTVTVAYILPSGCAATYTLTVNPTPVPISGTPVMCVGACVTLSDATSGGSWSISPSTIATVTGGTVCGVSAGTATVTYSIGTCSTSITATVLPTPTSIFGASSLCAGSCTTLTDATAGGTWSCSPTTVGTISSSTGTVCGVTAGTLTVSYTLASGCSATYVMTVYPTPLPISGTPSMCVGQCVTVSDGTPGGSWSVSPSGIATVTGGTVCGLAAGTATITYMIGSCYATITATVLSTPSAILGSTFISLGYTGGLSDMVAGGGWSSSSTTVATVDASGTVYGVSLGTATITYLLSTGCYATDVVTVGLGTPPIMGPTHICGSSVCITLSDGAPGGTWTSSNPAIASISSSGVLCSGSTPGTTTITYSTGACSGCTVTRVDTVFASPAPTISGGTSICVGQTTSLSNAVGGGTWSSSATSIATATAGPSSTTIVHGVSAGTSTIVYSIGGACNVSIIVTVNPTPSSISGPTVMCQNTPITLSNTVAGGTWTTTATTVVTFTPTTGTLTTVSGLSGGVAPVTYSIGSCFQSINVTVNPIAAINGFNSVCIGQTITLSDLTPGGAWSSSATTVATVGPTSGTTTTVHGVASGVAIITYMMPTGCFETHSVTVNSLPGPITGNLDVCVGGATSLSDAVAGGSWLVGSTAIATLSSSTAMPVIVSGGTAGTTTITYALGGSGCFTNTVVTVHSLPTTILGSTNLCQGSSTTLSSSPGGGTWSSAYGVVTVGATTGVVYGATVGTDIITYSLATGCIRATTVTVNPLPASITGSAQICVSHTTTLASSTSGGTWSSLNPTVATVVSGTGLVTGAAPGVATIVYTLGTGCNTNISVTVTPAPTAVLGSTNVCMGGNTTLSDGVPGGTWTSSDPTVASIGLSSGVLTGNASGTIIVYYTLGTGCATYVPVTVFPVAPVTGPNNVCVGQNVALADTALGGTWSSSSSSTATVTGFAGGTAVIGGVASGAVVISYSLPSGCVATYPMTVNPIPPAITGPSSVCLMQSVTLADLAGGGTWNSGSGSVAMITGTTATTATIQGINTGTSTISYSVAGCPATMVLLVNPLPAPISGPTQLCVGSDVTLSDVSSGGTWMSTRIAFGTIDATTGVLGGIRPGTTSITYTLGTGCTASTVATVYPNPTPILGATNLCVGSTATFSDATGGGTWSSSSTISVNPSTGDVTGTSGGPGVITYTLGSGCYVTATVMVNPTPPGIIAPSDVCQGSCTALSDAATGGGTWSSSMPSVGTVNGTTGLFCGISVGITTVTYTLAGTGCNTTTDITVDPVPAPVTGSPITCVGSTTQLSDISSGGNWSSTIPAVAGVDGTGLVTGASPGTSVISYAYGSGCAAVVTVTITPFPDTIAGNRQICLYSTNMLSDAVGGGTWYSVDPTVASINPTTGGAYGASVGSTVIIYTLGAGCTVTAPVNVLPLPELFNVTGGGNFCAGGAGRHIYLSGSEVGVNYLLYVGSTPTGTFAGTGAGIDFGPQTVGGTYYVVAISSITGCDRNMSGTATITVDPIAVPAVTINSVPGDTLCAGTNGTFTAVPVNGGAAPTYVWKVNGVNVGVASSYSFVPANGDVISVTLTSNAHCATPATATASQTLYVPNRVLPAVTMAISPNDTVCKGTAVTLTAVSTYSGPSPVYLWMNGYRLIGTGSPFSYIPSNGDNIYAYMISNYFCSTQDTVMSNNRVFTVDTPLIPIVTLYETPGYVTGHPSGTITFSAVVTNGGDSPAYQWFINGIAVPGATNSTFVHTGYNSPKEDSVSCDVTSSGYCPMTTHNWVYIIVSNTGVKPVITGAASLSVLPNPNKGEFTIKGSLSAAIDEDVNIEITDMLGQVVYRKTVAATNGAMNERILLSPELANGMYILNLHSDSDNLVFHIVVEK